MHKCLVEKIISIKTKKKRYLKPSFMHISDHKRSQSYNKQILQLFRIKSKLLQVIFMRFVMFIMLPTFYLSYPGMRCYLICKLFQNTALHWKVIFTIYIPVKMKDFFNAEISIYSRAEFFIDLFEDFLQRFSTEDRVRRFFSKMFEDFIQNK